MTDNITSGIAGEGGHWYKPDGTPAYQIPDAKGNFRNVTLRDARKHKLLPGFSTIAQMEHKPALERWKVNQAILACLTLPPIPGEPLAEFKRRAEEDMQAQAEQARERGVQLHAALEAYYLHGHDALPTDHREYVKPVVDWLEANVPTASWVAEKSFGNTTFGFGSKVDLYSPGVAVVDFKFKDFSDPKKIEGYPEHEMQLHAYAYGLNDFHIRKINLFISSTVPGLIVPVEWETRYEAWEAFQCLVRLWQIRKGYKP